MARQTAPEQSRPVVHYYPLPEQPAELVYPTAAEVAEQRRRMVAQRRRDAAHLDRWKQRRTEIAQRDHRARQFLLGLGAVVGTGLLAGVAAVVWVIWHALADVDWIVVLPLAAFVLVALGVGGHRCITIVQHWH